MSGTPFPAKARQVGAPHLAFCASFRPILYHFFHDCQGGLLFLFTFFIYFEKLRQFSPPCDYAVHSPMIQNITPQNAPASVPYRRTGPATVNILAPTPRIRPSERASMAGEATALANPVMGTSVPAPAYLAMRSKTPNPVSTAEISTSVMDASVPPSSRLMLQIPV